MKQLLPLLLCAAGCTAHAAPAGQPVPASAPARYLYVWAGDRDEKHEDFLAVVDVQPGSATYAQVIATEPVGRMMGSMPHHLEYELPSSDRLLFLRGEDSNIKVSKPWLSGCCHRKNGTNSGTASWRQPSRASSGRPST